MSNGISINGDMHGDIVQGDQHKGDIVHGNKDASQGAIDVAGDMHGDIMQTFSDDMALMALATAAQNMAEVLMTQAKEHMSEYSQLVEDWKAALREKPAPQLPEHTETASPPWLEKTKVFFTKIAPAVAKAALAGGLAGLGALVSTNPFLVALKATISELYNSVSQPSEPV